MYEMSDITVRNTVGTGSDHQMRKDGEILIILAVIGAFIVIVFSFVPMWIHWEPGDYFDREDNINLEIDVPTYYGILFTPSSGDSVVGDDDPVIQMLYGKGKGYERGKATQDLMVGVIDFPQRLIVLVGVLIILSIVVIVRWILNGKNSNKKMDSAFAIVDIGIPVIMGILFYVITNDEYLKLVFDVCKESLHADICFSYSWWFVLVGIIMVSLQGVSSVFDLLFSSPYSART